MNGVKRLKTIRPAEATRRIPGCDGSFEPAPRGTTSRPSATAEEVWRHRELTVCDSLGGRRYNGGERRQNTRSRRGGFRGDRSGERGGPESGVATQPGAHCGAARLE